MRGKFIVIYASNNLGKSAQAELLTRFINDRGIGAEKMKYPVYDSETGRLINAILRPKEGERLVVTDEELQFLFAQNRLWYQPELERRLDSGLWVVAEDYVGTGMAWGLTKGVDKGYLVEINQGLMTPDWSILLDAERRFTTGIEKGHRHEDAGEELWQRNRQIHLELAQELGWEVIERADRNVETVHEVIVDKLLRSGLL